MTPEELQALSRRAAGYLPENQYGRWTVLSRGPNKGEERAFNCKCECGMERVVLGRLLRTGKSKSCGCLKAEINHTFALKHGATVGSKYDPIYNAWWGIKARCGNPCDPHFRWYGARGIIVCAEWKNDFIAFRDWALVHGYAAGLTLDRENVDCNYSPENCRWVTWEVQASNKTNTHYLEFDGEKRSIGEWSRITGLGYQTIWTRIQYGWSAAKALTKPPAKSRWSKAVCALKDGK